MQREARQLDMLTENRITVNLENKKVSEMFVVGDNVIYLDRNKNLFRAQVLALRFNFVYRK